MYKIYCYSVFLMRHKILDMTYASVKYLPMFSILIKHKKCITSFIHYGMYINMTCNVSQNEFYHKYGINRKEHCICR